MNNIDKSILPVHIGIIMDGNRRWAKANSKEVAMGHKRGAVTLENITRFANKIGVKVLTVYAFSTENWKRTEEEVGALMILLKNYLDDFSKRIDTENIKIKISGDISSLSKDMQKSIQNSMNRTKDNTGTILNIAFNYGGRAEIVYAFKNIFNKIRNGELNIEEIDEDTISLNTYTSELPDPELIIRTGGEERLSNFLTWQGVYSELVFLEKLWPDFKDEDLVYVIEEYAKRKRNLGK